MLLTQLPVDQREVSLSSRQPGPLSLVEECRGSNLIDREDQSDATPALLCHKEPARRIQSPLLGALERKITPLGGILLAPRQHFLDLILDIEVDQSGPEY